MALVKEIKKKKVNVKGSPAQWKNRLGHITKNKKEIKKKCYIWNNNYSDIDENDTAQNQPKKKRRRTKVRKIKNLTIATINISGLKGKIKSLESLLESI